MPKIGSSCEKKWKEENGAIEKKKKEILNNWHVCLSALLLHSPLLFVTHRYSSCEEFAADAFLVFDNCRTFNEDESEVGKAGLAMRQFFESRWEEFYQGKHETNPWSWQNGEKCKEPKGKVPPLLPWAAHLSLLELILLPADLIFPPLTMTGLGLAFNITPWFSSLQATQTLTV